MSNLITNYEGNLDCLQKTNQSLQGDVKELEMLSADLKANLEIKVQEIQANEDVIKLLNCKLDQISAANSILENENQDLKKKIVGIEESAFKKQAGLLQSISSMELQVKIIIFNIFACLILNVQSDREKNREINCVCFIHSCLCPIYYFPFISL